MWTVTAESNYEDYGDLSTNYLPERHIQQLDEFDVNLDGISERIVTHNFVGRANAGSYGSDIIEGDTIIFSAIADNASIVPAETPNGFYVELEN